MTPKLDKPAAVFLGGLTLFYLLLSPLSMKGMGYASEQAAAARGLLTTFKQVLGGDFTGNALFWPRHGLLEPLLEVPFALAGHVAFGAATPGEDLVLSLQPVLSTSLLCTLVFVWIRRITGNTVSATTLALAAGLTTMIWPYAYIGLETTQSLFLFLAAYLVLADEKPLTWSRSLLFAVSAGIGVGVKANGFVLIPAAAFLVAMHWRRNQRSATIVSIAIITAIYLLNEYWRDLSPLRPGGSRAVFQIYRADGPLSVALSVLYLFVSPNKGLLIYSPILVLALASLRRAYRESPPIVIFALLTLAGLVAGSAAVVPWADEVWGPRYLHSAVAPLIVCLALVVRERRLRIKVEAPLLASMALGFGVSVLGVLFYYGSTALAATAASQRTLEDIQHDPAWNPVRFHAVLLSVWMRGPESEPVPWPPERHRWFPAPGESFAFQPSRTIDLREFAEPQPYVLKRLTR